LEIVLNDPGCLAKPYSAQLVSQYAGQCSRRTSSGEITVLPIFRIVLALAIKLAIEVFPDSIRTVAISGYGRASEHLTAKGRYALKTRKLGPSLEVSELGVGCMPMAGIGTAMYGQADVKESLATIDRAIELGVTFFDTAEVYGPHRNEELLGQAIRGRRERLVIATKFGFRFEGKKVVGTDSTPANIRKACEGSLQRLGIDTIDLLYQHRVDPGVPIEEVVGAVSRLIEEGKVRHIGLSEAGVETIKRAAATHPITAMQSEYSLWERDVEEEILPLCQDLNIGFVPYSPLGRGFLTGQITSRDDLADDDYRLNDPRYSPENFDKNLVIVGEVRSIAAAHSVSPAQIALAWLLAQGDDIVPIPGTKRRATLEDSMAAAQVKLTKDDLNALDAVAPRGGTAGPRYNEAMLSMVRL
jgi:aryl-alcohol dehydrogenase-like predicted oxidoreductase